MPEPQLFASGFNIIDGSYIDNFKITSHNVIEHNLGRHHYSYDVSISFSPPSSTTINSIIANQLASYFDSSVKIINSSYGTPYQCSMKRLSYSIDNNSLTIYFEGHAQRV